MKEYLHQNLARPSFQIRTWFELLVQNMPHTQPIVAEAAVYVQSSRPALQQGENVCEVKSQQIPHAKQHKA